MLNDQNPDKKTGADPKDLILEGTPYIRGTVFSMAIHVEV